MIKRSRRLERILSACVALVQIFVVLMVVLQTWWLLILSFTSFTFDWFLLLSLAMLAFSASILVFHVRSVAKPRSEKVMRIVWGVSTVFYLITFVLLWTSFVYVAALLLTGLVASIIGLLMSVSKTSNA